MTRNEFDAEKFPSFLQVWTEFFNKNKFEIVYLPKDDLFLKKFRKILPKEITKRQIIE